MRLEFARNGKLDANSDARKDFAMIEQAAQREAAAIEEDGSSSEKSASQPLIVHWPSFIAGIGSLLDLSGELFASEMPIRQVTIRPPERAIADAWLFVGHSLREVLPPVDEPTAVDE